MGTTFAIFNSLGKTPVWKERLDTYISGKSILCLIVFITFGLSSSHPDELSFKCSMIFSTSFSVTGELWNIMLVSFFIYSKGFLFEGAMAAARVAPTLTKNLLNFSVISLLSLTMVSLHLNLVHTGLDFFLLIIILRICHDFFTFDLCS